MARAGAEFEQLVFSVYAAVLANNPDATVTIDEKIQGPDGPRQFDVVIRQTVAGINLLIVVECKDYNSIVDLPVIDSFYSKLRDINASKGIIVARRGFSRNARQKALRLGLDLCVAGYGQEMQITGLHDVPILVRILRPWSTAVSWTIKDPTQKGVNASVTSSINGLPVPEIIIIGLARDLVRPIEGSHIFLLKERGSCDYFIDLEEFFGHPLTLPAGDKQVEVKNPIIGLRLIEKKMIGYTKDLNSTRALVNLHNGYQNIVLSPDQFGDLDKQLRLADQSDLDRIEEIPHIECIVCEPQDQRGECKLEVWRYPE